MTRMRLFVWIPLLLTGLLASLCVLLAVWLLYSEAGLQKAADYTMQLEPRLQLLEPSGSLLGELHFAGISWRDQGIDVELVDVSTQFEPFCFFLVDVCGRRLNVASVTIAITPDPAAADDSEPLQLPTVDLPFDILVNRATLASLHINYNRDEVFGAQDISITRFLWHQANLSFRQLNFSAYNERFLTKGKLKLDKDYPLRLQARLEPTFMPDLSAYIVADDSTVEKAGLAASLQGSLRQLQGDFTLNGQLALKGTASINLLDTALPYSATVRSQRKLKLQIEQQALAISDASLVLNGDLQGLQFSVDSAQQVLLPTGSLDTHLNASGTTDFNSLDVQSLQLDSDQGQLLASGKLYIDDSQTSEFAVQLQAINPAMFDPAYPGKLALQAVLSITETFSNPRFTARLSGLNGELLAAQIDSSGTVEWTASQHVHFDQWTLRHDSNQLQVNGEFPGQRLDMKLDITHLSNYLADASGQLSIAGKVSGSFEKPSLSAHIVLSDARYLDYQAASIDSQLEISQLGWQASSITLQGDKLGMSGQQQPMSIKLELTGKRQSADLLHTRLSLVVSDDENWKTELLCVPVLGLQNYAVKARCDKAAIDINEQLWLPSAGVKWSRWLNEQPLVMNWQYQPQQLAINRFCLRNVESALCLASDLEWGSDRTRALSLTASELPLYWLQAFTGDAYDYSGQWGISATLKQRQSLDPASDAPADWQFDGQLAAQQLLLSTQLDADKKLDVPIENVGLDFSANRDGFAGSFSLLSNLFGTINGELDYRAGKLTGKLLADSLDLQPVQGLFPEISQLSANASSDLSFSLFEDSLELFGDVSFTGIAINSRSLPFDVKEGELLLNFQKQKLSLKGAAAIGDGHADLAGNGTWSAHDWRAELSLKTSAVRLEPLPRSYLNVLADLNLVAVPGQLSIGGQLNIPVARIELEKLPQNAVGVSDDTIIEEATLDESTTQVVTDVKAILGDDVRFRGFGLETFLEGQLRVKQEPGRLVSGNGVVNLKKGRFRAYGQDLLIEEGRLVFAGPLSNPQLYVIAVRNHTEENVRVGVQATGSAKEPVVTIFSSPAMSEQDKLYYLLTGRGPNSLNADDSRLAQQTAIALGLAQTNKRARDIGESVGIQDFQVGTDVGRNGEEAQVSGYITAELYLLYGVSIFDQLSSITARYALTRNTYVEVYDSVSSAIDVFWLISDK